MKVLKNVDREVEYLDGFNLPAGTKLSTMRMLLKVLLNRTVAKNPDDAIDTNQLLLKLRLVEPDIQLENAEFKALKEKVDANEMKLPQGEYGQLVAYVRECEKDVKDSEPK